MMPELQLNITQKFEKGHPAIDIALSAGTKLYSPFPGTIYYGYDPKSGYYAVITDSENQKQAVLCHLLPELAKERIKSKEMKIQQGELIGYVGSTGHSTGPHLHLMLKKRIGNNLIPYDPLTDTITISNLISPKPKTLETIAEKSSDKMFKQEITNLKPFCSIQIKNIQENSKPKENIIIKKQIVEDETALIGTTTSITFLLEMRILHEKANKNQKNEFKKAFKEAYKCFQDFLALRSPITEVAGKYRESEYLVRNYSQYTVVDLRDYGNIY